MPRDSDMRHPGPIVRPRSGACEEMQGAAKAHAATSPKDQTLQADDRNAGHRRAHCFNAPPPSTVTASTLPASTVPAASSASASGLPVTAKILAATTALPHAHFII